MILVSFVFKSKFKVSLCLSFIIRTEKCAPKVTVKSKSNFHDLMLLEKARNSNSYFHDYLKKRLRKFAYFMTRYKRGLKPAGETRDDG